MPVPSASSQKNEGCHLSALGQGPFLEFHEGVFLRQAPVQPNILHGEVKQCVHMVGEARDGVTVEIDKLTNNCTSFLVDGISQLMTLEIFTESILMFL
jgi:hypothetical protein